MKVQRHIARQLLLTAICLWGTVVLAHAEYNHELGLTAGTSFYLGDANHVTVFNRASWTAGAFYRYNIDTRWAIRFKGQYARMNGNSDDFGYKFPNGQTGVKFSRGLTDLSLTTEFNFLDIGESRYYKGRFKATPYIALGIGCDIYNNYGDGHMFNVNLPFAIGGKWLATKRLTLGLEWSIHKLFADDLDVTGPENAILKDPYGTGKVGFIDTDWYSTLWVSISCKLFTTRKFCK